jgi:hypothetical protein
MTTTPDLAELARQAEQGRRAAEALAAHERERLAGRTAQLQADQRDWDTDLCRRGPALDADLTERRQEATRALQAAVERCDLGAALDAWRDEAAARFAQRGLRDQWRQAQARTGTGTPLPEPSLRLDEADEHLGFLASLDRAATASAQVEAELVLDGLVTERPTAPPHELLPGPEAALEHAPRCPDPTRTEVSQAPVGRRSYGLVIRCTSCGVSEVLYQPPPEPEEAEAQAKGAPLPDVRLPETAGLGV